MGVGGIMARRAGKMATNPPFCLLRGLGYPGKGHHNRLAANVQENEREISRKKKNAPEAIPISHFGEL